MLKRVSMFVKKNILKNVILSTVVSNLRGHTDIIETIAFSPGGQLLASGGQDYGIRLWDLPSGKNLKVLPGHSDWINKVIFHPEGNILASASDDKTIKLWDIASGELINSFSGHTFWVKDLVFSSRGDTLISGSVDKTVRYWDIKGGETLLVLDFPFDVEALALHPRYQVLAVGLNDGSVSLFDQKGNFLKSFSSLFGQSSTSHVNDLEFSPDGNYLACVNEFKSKPVVFKVEEDYEQLVLEEDYFTGVNGWNRIIFTADSQYVGTFKSSHFHLFNFLSGEPVRESEHVKGIRDIAFSPDISRLALTSNQEIQVRDAGDLPTRRILSLQILPDTLGMYPGEEKALSVKGYYQDGTSVDIPPAEVLWSLSSYKVAQVDDRGTVKAKEPGNAIISLTTPDGSLTSSSSLTVSEPFIPVSGVSLDRGSFTMVEGDQWYLEYRVMPQDASDKEVSWEVDDPQVLSVGQGGKVQALSPGEAAVTIRAGGGKFSSTCSFRVEKRIVQVRGVELERTSLTLQEGDRVTLEARVLPPEAEEKTLFWMSDNPQVARVDKEGQVTAISPGLAVVTATTARGWFSAACLFTVEKRVVPVTGVELDRDSCSLREGEIMRLEARVLPREASDQSLYWTSDNPRVARVDDRGQVEALSPGPASIKVAAGRGEFSAACRIKVEQRVIPVTGIGLDRHGLTLVEGDEARLEARLTPPGATPREIVWEVDNRQVAWVGEEGSVRALTPGEARVTAKAGNKDISTSCTIFVKKRIVPGEEIILDKADLSLVEGEEVQLKASVMPLEADEGFLVWESSDRGVAQVDGRGRVKASGQGTAVIKVSIPGGPVEAGCPVEVTALPGSGEASPGEGSSLPGPGEETGRDSDPGAGGDSPALGMPDNTLRIGRDYYQLDHPGGYNLENVLSSLKTGGEIYYKFQGRWYDFLGITGFQDLINPHKAVPEEEVKDWDSIRHFYGKEKG